MAKLIRFVYFSKAAHDFSEGELDELLAKSQRNNHDRNVSGLLLYDDRMFFQVLEGAPENVYERLGVIEADPRHNGLTAVHEEEIDERDFSEWSMGQLKDTDEEQLISTLINLRNSAPPEVQRSMFQEKTLPFLRNLYAMFKTARA